MQAITLRGGPTEKRYTASISRIVGETARQWQHERQRSGGRGPAEIFFRSTTRTTHSLQPDVLMAYIVMVAHSLQPDVVMGYIVMVAHSLPPDVVMA